MALLPDDFQRRASNLMNQGCELTLLERALLRIDSSRIGSESWRFPGVLVEAVKFPHKPEGSQSPLARDLYLAQRHTNPEEDLPSPARSKTAMDRLSLDSETTYQFDLGTRIPNPLRF